MARLLQLIDRSAPFDADYAVHLLQPRLGADFSVDCRTVGRGGDFPNGLATVRALRRYRYDLIHCWSPLALLAAAMAGGSHLVFTPPLHRLRRTIHLLRAVMACRPVEVALPSTTIDRTLVQHGVDPTRCHLIRPGVDFSQLQRRKNPALRAELGLSDNHIVLLGLGESTDAAAHDLAGWAASILHEISPRYRLLLWGRGEALPRVAGRIRKLDPHLPPLVAEHRLRRRVELSELLSVADIALVTATGIVAPLAMATAMASGVPIVSTATYATSELLEDRHTALMPVKPLARLIARRVLELREDPGLQWRLADMARTEAYEHFSVSRFIDQHRTLYRQVLAGQPVHLEQPHPAAGARFHGRA